MQRSALHVMVAFLACGATASEALVRALCSKDETELRGVAQKIALQVAEGVELDILRSMVYEQAQLEVPGITEKDLKPWPGPCPAVPPKSKKKVGDTEVSAETLSQLSEMMFKKMDADEDGSLSREEMAHLLTMANAEAKAKGEVEFDLFASLDADNDGKVDRAESDSYFAQITQRLGPGGPSSLGAGKEKKAAKPAKPAKKPAGGKAAGKEVEQMAGQFFKALDKDGARGHQIASRSRDAHTRASAVRCR